MIALPARFIIRYRWAVIAAWVALAALLVPRAAHVQRALAVRGGPDRLTESKRVSQLIDAAFPSPGILGMTMGKDRDFAGDVQIVRADFQTRFQHRLASRRERASAMQYQLDAIERGSRAARVGQIESACWQAVLLGQGADLLRVAPGDDWCVPAPHRFFENKSPGITVGAVDHPFHLLRLLWGTAKLRDHAGPCATRGRTMRMTWRK